MHLVGSSNSCGCHGNSCHGSTCTQCLPSLVGNVVIINRFIAVKEEIATLRVASSWRVSVLYVLPLQWSSFSPIPPLPGAFSITSHGDAKKEQSFFFVITSKTSNCLSSSSISSGLVHDFQAAVLLHEDVESLKRVVSLSEAMGEERSEDMSGAVRCVLSFQGRMASWKPLIQYGKVFRIGAPTLPSLDHLCQSGNLSISDSHVIKLVEEGFSWCLGPSIMEVLDVAASVPLPRPAQQNEEEPSPRYNEVIGRNLLITEGGMN